MADSEPRSGAGSAFEKVENDLREGRQVSWRFNAGEPRLFLKLPEEFGGAEHRVSLVGGYTLCSKPA